MNLFYSLFKYIDIIHLAYINRLFVSIIRVNILNDNINSDEENKWKEIMKEIFIIAKDHWINYFHLIS